MQDGDDHNWNEWAESLRVALDERGKAYQNLAKERNRAPETWVETENGQVHPIAGTTQAMAGVLSVVCSAIQDLPCMSDNPGFKAIHDLVVALIDLSQGATPLLLTAGPKVDDALRVGRATVEAYAVLFVRALQQSKRCNYGQARTYVASILSNAGYRGHKGAPISAATLQTWHDNYIKEIMPQEFRDLVNSELQKLKASPKWPQPLEALLAVIRDTAQSEGLINKYGAPPRHHI